VVGYLGPNGSGKTTTIRMLLGLLEPSEGKRLCWVRRVQAKRRGARAGGYMSQKFAIYDDLTVLENLTFYGGVYGITDKARIKRTLELVGLQRTRLHADAFPLRRLASATGTGHRVGARAETALPG
jgi:ABC-2 type transport system ATP-binding protein